MPKTRTSGIGRPKGVPNKINGDIREMILGALQDVGGRDYLAARAIDTPGPFLALVGKILPTQVVGENGGALVVDFRWADPPPTTIDAQPVSHETTDDPPAITFISDC